MKNTLFAIIAAAGLLLEIGSKTYAQDAHTSDGDVCSTAAWYVYHDIATSKSEAVRNDSYLQEVAHHHLTLCEAAENAQRSEEKERVEQAAMTPLQVMRLAVLIIHTEMGTYPDLQSCRAGQREDRVHDVACILKMMPDFYDDNAAWSAAKQQAEQEWADHHKPANVTTSK